MDTINTNSHFFSLLPLLLPLSPFSSPFPPSLPPSPLPPSSPSHFLILLLPTQPSAVHELVLAIVTLLNNIALAVHNPSALSTPSDSISNPLAFAIGPSWPPRTTGA